MFNQQSQETSPHPASAAQRRTGRVLTLAQEGQVQVQICRELAMGNETQSPGTMLDSSSPGRDVVEYHNDVHFMSILGEVMGHRGTKRMIRIVVEENPTAPDEVCDQRLPPNVKRELSGLDETDVDYLFKKGAFWLPPSHCWCVWYYVPGDSECCADLRSEQLLRIFFDVVYPYAPVLNRVEFMQSYQSAQHSSLLLNSILVNAVPYAPTALLKECGFEDRSSAQKHFFSTAVLLYDFGCGKNQIHRLQSSLLLGTVIFSFVSEKDFRYWLHNAVRIATRMGLHRMCTPLSCSKGSEVEADRVAQQRFGQRLRPGHVQALPPHLVGDLCRC